MSRRREINKRLEALSDIAGIMSAMKGLALMETRILKDLLNCQQTMVSSIEKTAAEFFSSYPEQECKIAATRELCIIIGSEQGFCGDFNETLLAEMHQRAHRQTPSSVNWILVGRRLASRLNKDNVALFSLPGAVVADEIPSVLLQLTQQLSRLMSQAQTASCGFSVLYHCDASDSICLRHLLPLRYTAELAVHTAYPPELNITPEEFLLRLTDHYLYAALNEVLYSSLMAENRQRQIHMDQSLQRLDENKTRLQLTYNIQRQEDITEEIETILLASDMLAAAD